MGNGYRPSAGEGSPMQSTALAFLAAGAIAALIAAGCAKNTEQTSTSTSATSATTSGPTTMTNAAAGAQGDAAHGKTIFSTNCANCHGAVGTEGGIGPSLKNEKSRKNYRATIAWIKNPQPPMPKLFPDTLNEKAVDDVAAYVQSL
jgi:mono/diheme cytochrome c family protein